MSADSTTCIRREWRSYVLCLVLPYIFKLIIARGCIYEPKGLRTFRGIQAFMHYTQSPL
jgi:hypothetical protein